MLYYKQDVCNTKFAIFSTTVLRENGVKKIYNGYNVLVFAVRIGKDPSNKWVQSGFKIRPRITFIKLDKIKQAQQLR